MIDIHQHVLPASYLNALASRGIVPLGGVPWPTWSPELAIETMDRNGIEKGIMFVSEPGVYFGDKDWAKHLARMVNEDNAKVISDYPARFGNFALLPLPLVDEALLELDYALGTLKLDGVALLTNYGGQYLGNPEFDPLFAELNRRKAIVFIHPTSAPKEQQSKIKVPGYLLEFVFDTTRAITNLIISGTLERYPDIRIICAHAGGTIPYLAQRLEYTRIRSKEQFPQIDEGAPKGAFAYLQDLYYDTGLSYGDANFAFLEKFVGYKQIVFGSDWPFAPEQWMTENILAVNNYFKGNSKILKAVQRENALEILQTYRG